MLDFCGRAPQVSVKNFQLVYPEEPDEVLFQLGRLDDENFSVGQEKNKQKNKYNQTITTTTA